MEIYKNLSLEDLEGEVWKDIPNYEGLYQVSNLGRVKSLPRLDNKGRKINLSIRKQTVANVGYPCVSLYSKEGGKKNAKLICVHRLVAQAFVPNPQNKPCIDHINTIRTDNRVENIRWVTYAENVNNPITKNGMIQTLKSQCNTEEGRKRMKRMSDLAFSEEAKAKKRETIKRPEVLAKWTKAHGRPVIQLTLEGEYIAEYSCIREAHEKTGACHIGDVCSGKRHWAAGYLWKYKD